METKLSSINDQMDDFAGTLRVALWNRQCLEEERVINEGLSLIDTSLLRCTLNKQQTHCAFLMERSQMFQFQAVQCRHLFKFMFDYNIRNIVNIDWFFSDECLSDLLVCTGFRTNCVPQDTFSLIIQQGRAALYETKKMRSLQRKFQTCLFGRDYLMNRSLDWKMPGVFLQNIQHYRLVNWILNKNG